MSKLSIKTALVVYRDQSRGPLQIAGQAGKWLKKRGVKVHLTAQDDLLKPPSFNKKEIDFVLVLGGDGTYLRTVRFAAGCSIPFLGVNMGALGFLTVHRQESLEHCLSAVWAGRMVIEKRSLISLAVKKNNQVLARRLALNDVVIERGSFSHLISVSIGIQNQAVYSMKADGLIVSSPTGSTAYNLAGGGPILHPHVNALAVTPICSHSLTNRPVIVPDSCKMTFQINNKNQSAFLTVDGEKTAEISKQHQIIVQKSAWLHKTLRTKDHNYFLLLKDKFKFSQ